MGKDISCKYQWNKIKRGYNNIRQSSLHSKENYQRQKGTSHDDKRFYLLRRHPEYICTRRESQKTWEVKRENLETDKSTNTAGDVNIHLSTTDRTTRQIFNRDTEISTTPSINLINAYGTLPSSKRTVSSSAHWTSTKTDHILSHKTNLK